MRRLALATVILSALAAPVAAQPAITSPPAFIAPLCWNGSVWASCNQPLAVASYRAVSFGNSGYATPQDLACLRNPAGSGKTLYVTQFGIEPQSTSATLATWITLKRLTLNGGGTLASAVTPVPFDSADVAAAAALDVYTAAPSSLGTSAGTLNLDVGQTTAAAAPAPLFGLFAGNSGANGFPYFQLPGTTTLTQPITLHASEEICINFNGAALPAGFTAGYIAEWTEH